MMLQLLLGGASGVYVIFRMFKQKIRSLLGLHSEPDAGMVEMQPLPQEEEPRRRQS